MKSNIKDILEDYIDANGITRAEIMAKTGRSPQAWSKLANDAKWSTLCEIMSAMGFDLGKAVSDMLYGKVKTTGFIECPNCHTVWKIKVEED